MRDRQTDRTAYVTELLDRLDPPTDGTCRVAGCVHRLNSESPATAPRAEAA